MRRRELFDRIVPLAEHFRRVGERLDKSVAAYNNGGSLDHRIVQHLRKFQNLHGRDEGAGRAGSYGTDPGGIVAGGGACGAAVGGGWRSVR